MAGHETGHAVMRVLIPIAAVIAALSMSVASADPDGAGAIPDPVHDALDVFGNQTIPGGQNSGADGKGSDTFTSYDDGACAPNQMLLEEYRSAGVAEPWQLASSGCGAAATAGPVVTPDLVLEAMKTVGLPVSSFEVPAKTLVHYETTVYTETATFARTVNVVNFDVDVRARPSRFTWYFGDGEVRTTSSPGAPYPSHAITHEWLDAHRTFRPRVDTAYAVSYRVDDGRGSTSPNR